MGKKRTLGWLKLAKAIIPGFALLLLVVVALKGQAAGGESVLSPKLVHAQSPVLAISKSASPDPVRAGAQLTYTIRVTNTGTVDLHATVTDTLPAQVTPTGPLIWMPTVTAFGGVWTRQVVVTVEVGYAGMLTNVVEVTTDEGPADAYTETTTSLSSGCEDDYEPDDDYTTATAVTVPSITSHNFDIADDDDWVRFQGTAGITYTIKTMNLAVSGTQWVDTKMILYRWDGSDLVQEDDDDDSGDEPFADKIEWPVTTTGWYYVNVGHVEGGWSFSGCDAFYDLAVILTGVPCTTTLVIEPETLTVDNTATMTATVVDCSSSPLAGQVITFSTTSGLGSGIISPITAPTNASGQAVSYISSTLAGPKLVTATTPNLVAGTDTVTFTAGPPFTITLEAVPDTLPVNDTAVLSATVFDQFANPVPGQVITFSTSSDLGSGGIGPQTDTTDSNGRVTSNISSTITGTKLVTATAPNLVTGTTMVTFIAPSPAPPSPYVYLPIILKGYPLPEPSPAPEPTPECCPIVEATVGVGDGPRGIAIITATNRIYVANHGSNSVSVIDGGTNAVVNTIDLGSGSGPNGIAYHPSGFLYVSLSASDTVAVINTTTWAVTTVAVGDDPAGVAANPVTGKVYVANFGSDSTALDTVSVISGTAVVGTIPVEDAPSQIAVNPATNRIFVTNHGHADNYGYGSSVSVIDGSTDTVVKTIRLVTEPPTPPMPGQGPHGIAVNPNTNKIYVAVVDSHQLVVIDGNNLDAPPTYIAPPLDVPIWMVAVNPDLNRVYAVGCDEVWVHKVFVLDGATNTWLPCDLNVGTNPKQGVAFNPETGRLYVSNEDSDNVTVLWTCSASDPPPTPTPTPTPISPPPPPPGPCYPKVETSITVGNDPRGVAYNDDDNLIYVANYGDGTVSVINGVSYNVTKVITSVTGANGVAYDSDHGLVYVTNQSMDTLTVISAATNAIVGTLPVGDQPHGAAYNPTSHKVYVANYAEDTVTIIDANTMTTTTTISGLSEPAHITVNPVRNKVYVSNHGNGKVTVIRGTDDAVLATVSLGSSGPYGIAADTQRNLIYVVSIDVPDLNAPNLVTIDGDTDQVKSNQWGRVNIHKIDGSLVPLRVMAVNPYLGPSAGGGHLYITSSSGDTAGDGSPGTDQLLMSRKGWPEGFNRPNPLDVGSRPEEGVAVDLTNNRVFVTARDVNRLTVIQDTGDHGQLCVETFALDGYIIEPVP